MSDLVRSLQQLRGLFAAESERNADLHHAVIAGANYEDVNRFRDWIPKHIMQPPQTLRWLDRVCAVPQDWDRPLPGFFYSFDLNPGRGEALSARFHTLCESLPELGARLTDGPAKFYQSVPTEGIVTLLHDLALRGTTPLIRLQRGRVWRARDGSGMHVFADTPDVSRSGAVLKEMMEQEELKRYAEMSQTHELPFPHEYFGILKPDVFTATVALIDTWLTQVPQEESSGTSEVGAKHSPVILLLERQQVKVKDKCYDLTPTAIQILKTLLDANGQWVSGKSLRNSEGSRPDMIISKMPPQVKELIESSKQNGYRVLRATT